MPVNPVVDNLKLEAFNRSEAGLNDIVSYRLE